VTARRGHWSGVVALLLGSLVILLGAAPAQKKRSDKDLNLKAGARAQLCVDCHDTFAERLKKRFVHKPIKDGDCTGCHNPHTSNYEMLLSAQSGELCMGCHDDLVPSETKSTHQVFVEGKCLSCHDPHAANNENNLLQAGSALCFECHESLGDKISKSDLQHDPVEEDCLNCHNPHASAVSINLLNDAQPELCVECHETDDSSFRKAHKKYPVDKARCTSCHDPHGSSTAGLLYDNVHEPVSERKCDECHQGLNSATPFALKEPGFKLCEGCHYEEVADAFNKKRVHWPLVDNDGCINCHAPHASPQEGLLKEPMLVLCGRCHSDTVARQERSQTKHEPIADGECTECHSPHSADNLFLIPEPTYPELCEKCHEWQTHSTHPIGEKIIDPRNKNVSVQCLSCHRTHGTEYEHFLYFETTNDMCVQCHSEYRR